MRIEFCALRTVAALPARARAGDRVRGLPRDLVPGRPGPRRRRRWSTPHSALSSGAVAGFVAVVYAAATAGGEVARGGLALALLGGADRSQAMRDRLAAHAAPGAALGAGRARSTAAVLTFGAARRRRRPAARRGDLAAARRRHDRLRRADGRARRRARARVALAGRGGDHGARRPARARPAVLRASATRSRAGAPAARPARSPAAAPTTSRRRGRAGSRCSATRPRSAPRRLRSPPAATCPNLHRHARQRRRRHRARRRGEDPGHGRRSPARGRRVRGHAPLQRPPVRARGSLRAARAHVRGPAAGGRTSTRCAPRSRRCSSRPGRSRALLRLVLTRGGRRIALDRAAPAPRAGRARDDVRYAPNRVLDGLKTLSYAGNMLARRLAEEAGYDEALLVTPHGRVLEGPTWSFFWVRDGELLTPPLEDRILGSITRARILARDRRARGAVHARRPARRRGGVHRVHGARGAADRGDRRPRLPAAPGPVTLRTREALATGDRAGAGCDGLAARCARRRRTGNRRTRRRAGRRGRCLGRGP